MDIGKNILPEERERRGHYNLCVFMCFLGSGQYGGNYMFPQEGREKSWPNVQQELLNENTCLGVAVVATH